MNCCSEPEELIAQTTRDSDRDCRATKVHGETLADLSQIRVISIAALLADSETSADTICSWAQNTTRQPAGVLAVDEQRFAVHDHCAITAGAEHKSSGSGGEVA
ncbi:unannotated protein [freshwater metagenome]|uniref:Unannotated protein n=1 Tax=freshwater metagenome TaxID=449393 RepID=A0A6J7JJX2_9ZZZZ